MKLIHLREVMDRFIESLDDVEMDEFWGTAKDEGEEVRRKLMGWAHKNRDWLTHLDQNGHKSAKVSEELLQEAVLYLEMAKESYGDEVDDFIDAALKNLKVMERTNEKSNGSGGQAGDEKNL